MLEPVEAPTPEYVAVERAVMQRMIQPRSVVSSDIEAQYAVATIGRRELSGTGFFSHFTIPATAPRISPPDLEISSDAVLSNGLSVGFTLFVREGQLAWLEGYTYGDEAWPERPVIREWEVYPE